MPAPLFAAVFLSLVVLASGAGALGSRTVAHAGLGASTYPVTFLSPERSNGTPWTITINGQSWESNGTSLTLQEPNGTYRFQSSFNASGALRFYNGSFTVNGGPQTVQFPAAASSPPPAEASRSGTAGSVGLLAIAAVVVVAAIAVTIVGAVARSRVKSPAGAPPAEPDPEHRRTIEEEAASPAGTDDDPLGHML